MNPSAQPHPHYPNARWRKSSHSSDPDLAVCVEIAAVGDGRHAVRDSTDPCGAVLALGPGALKSLLHVARSTSSR